MEGVCESRCHQVGHDGGEEVPPQGKEVVMEATTGTTLTVDRGGRGIHSSI